MGTVIYELAKELANILRTFPTSYQEHLGLGEGEYITSYDVKTLIMSVPVGPAISIINHNLKQGTHLQHTSSTSIQHITTLLEFCLKNTYFLPQGKYNEQVCWAAMGSPISYIMVNLFMEEFEIKSINIATHPPKWWLRYVDDALSSKGQNTAN